MSIVVGIIGGALLGVAGWRLLQTFLPIQCLGRWCNRLCVVSGLAGGLLGALLGWRLGLSWPLLFGLLVTALLTMLSFIDLSSRRLPYILVGVLFLIGCLQPAVGILNWRMMFTGAAYGAALFVILAVAGRGAMGAGDVALAIAIGAVLGLPSAIKGLAWGIVAGGIGAILLLVTHSATAKDKMAYGPYLAAGAWVTYMGMLGVW